MPDIDMFGRTYMQQVAEASTGAGLHIERGIWATVPPTTDPAVGATVVRMASIPHGTVMLAQGAATTQPGAPTIDDNKIPFFLGDPRRPTLISGTRPSSSPSSTWPSPPRSAGLRRA